MIRANGVQSLTCGKIIKHYNKITKRLYPFKLFDHSQILIPAAIQILLYTITYLISYNSNS